MRRATPLVLATAFAAALLCGWAIASGDLGLAQTVLVGFGALAALVTASLLAELARRGPRRAVVPRRRSRAAHL